MKQLTIFILISVICLPLFAQTGDKNFIDQPFIEVNGRSELEIVPNLIHLKVIISEKDNKGKVPLEQLERHMMKALNDIGIDVKKDVSIIDFASNFQFYTFKKTDIRTSKEYQVIVHSGNMAAKVYFELEKLDISNISINKLDHSQMDHYRQQVKIEAVKAAKNKAIALCQAIGEKAGKAIHIREVNRGFYAGRMEMMESNSIMKIAGSMDKMQELDIEFQKLKLEYEIEARFIIQ